MTVQMVTHLPLLLPLSLLLPFLILLPLPPHLLLPLLLAFPLHLYLPLLSIFLSSPSSYLSPSPSSSISAQISPTEAPVIDIQTANSFLQLSLSPSLKTNLTNIHTVQLMFRTRQPNGVIYTMQSFSTLEQFVIEVSV